MSRNGIPRCSVVVTACNEGEMLAGTVASVLGDSEYPDVEVVVVDDGSVDGSVEGLSGFDSRVEVLRGESLGLSRARNLGAEHASGDVLVFIDAHCRVFPGWLTALAGALAAPDAGVVGPAFCALDADPGSRRGCGMTWINDRLETAWFVPPEEATPYEVPLLPGGCHAYRAQTFVHLGRFDEGMTRWGFEDVEISLRAWLLGYRVLAVPAALVAHDFREERNFEVTQEGVLYNYLRLLHLHFSPARIAHLLSTITHEPGVGDALRELLRSDVLELRRELERVRVCDDDWFFATFAPTLPVARPEPPSPHPPLAGFPRAAVFAV